MANICLIDTNILSHYLNINPKEKEYHVLSLALFEFLKKERFTIVVPTVVLFELLQSAKSIEAANDIANLTYKSIIYADFNYKAASLGFSIRNGKPFKDYIDQINPNGSKSEIKTDMMIVATAIANNIGLIISDDSDIVTMSKNHPNITVKSYNDFPLQRTIDFQEQM